MTRRVLITGAAGFAGSHLVDLLTGTDEVHAWTRATHRDRPVGPVTWHRVDLMDREVVTRTVLDIRPDVVFHCAGSPHVASSWADSATPLAQNVLGTHHVLDALRRAGRPCRVVIPGSATVYRSSPDPIPETGALAPVSPYALSKYAQELLGLRAVEEDGLGVVVTRSFNHTGARQTAEFVAPSFARQIAAIERGTAEPVIKVGNLDARRDICDVRDVVRAYDALARHGRAGSVYNVASGTAHAMRALLDGLLALSPVQIRIEQDPARMRPHDTPVLTGDASKLRQATGWVPQIGWEQMLADLLAYWRQQPLL